ncbi:MAG: GxxExxY protein [Candidatus Solibacter sp.]
MSEDEIAHQIAGAAAEVHKELGPDLLASFYASALALELNDRGVQYVREPLVPVTY